MESISQLFDKSNNVLFSTFTPISSMYCFAGMKIPSWIPRRGQLEYSDIQFPNEQVCMIR